MKPNTTRILLLVILNMQVAMATEYPIDERAMDADARDMALGGLVCTLDDEPDRSMGFTCLMPLMLKELSIRGFRFHTERNGLGLAIGATQSGNEDWMESMGRIHMDKRLNKQLHIGVEVDMLLQQDALDQKAWTVFPQVECRYDMTQKISFGATWINPVGAWMNTSVGKVPLNIAAFLGTRCKPVANCLIYGEIGGWTNQWIRGRMGLEYALSESFLLRTGFSTGPLLPSWGIGGKIKKIHYSLSGNIHPILGLSNGFSLQYSW